MILWLRISGMRINYIGINGNFIFWCILNSVLLLLVCCLDYYFYFLIYLIFIVICIFCIFIIFLKWCSLLKFILDISNFFVPCFSIFYIIILIFKQSLNRTWYILLLYNCYYEVKIWQNYQLHRLKEF